MKVGQILVAKSGKFYIKAEKTFTANEGDALFLSTPQEDINFLVSSGRITQEEGDAKLAKVPEFVKYNIKLAGNTQTL